MGRYRRTVSFPNPSPNFRPNPAGGNYNKSHHVRSISLPCGRSHPLIPQLRDQINGLRNNWEEADHHHRAGSGWICDGLARMKRILDSLDDVLQLPQVHDSLSIEKLLEDFLRFVDAYGIFQASLLGLKQELSEAQVAIRRKDDSKLGLFIKAQKKIANDIGKLVSAVGSISELPISSVADDHDDDIGDVIRDVHRSTISVSSVLFSVISTSFGPARKPTWAGLRRVKKLEEGGIIEEFQEVIEGVESLLGLRKKENHKNNNEEMMRIRNLKKMQEMEDCIGEIERGSERVFRSLISTRVSLLNILTHA